MKRTLAILLSAVASSASAYNVQIGITGLYTMDRVYTNNAFVFTIVPRNAHFERGNVQGVEIDEHTGQYDTHVALDRGYLTLSTQNGYYGKVTIPMAETTYVGTFGYYYSAIPGQDWRWFNAVCTMRGDPYSSISNFTGEDLNINGVLIKAGTSERLPFPHTLAMDEVPDVHFYDPYTGAAILPETDWADRSYWDGAYHLSWAGDFCITNGTSMTNREVSVERLVYSDVDTNKLLYAQNNAPIYQGVIILSTNVSLMTWWDFNQNEWGDPQAKINGEVVCPSHDTSHLISYHVNVGDVRVSEMSGVGSFTFTMSQTPQSGHSGGYCIMKVWDAQYGNNKEAYAATPQNHKAEISAGTGVATFRVTLDILTRDWKVEPAN